MGDWLGRQDGEPASDLDVAVLLLNSLDLLEDPADRLTDLAWFREVMADVGRGDIADALADGDLRRAARTARVAAHGVPGQLGG